jgi:type VI secretion system protein ImpA
MSSAVAEVTSIEALLAPIPGDKPVGENLQYSGLHDEIREARRSEEVLDQGQWQRETKSADWQQVIDVATDALSTRTKDLQICVWLAEALAKQYGLDGLRDALKLTRGLLENFWESLYPEIDEGGDLEARANALSWLDRQLAGAVRETPLTKCSTGENYQFYQWEVSKQFDIPENADQLGFDEKKRANDLREQAAKEGKVTTEQWRVAYHGTRRAFYEEIYAALKECRAEFQLLDRLMDEKFDRQTPGLGELKKSLEDIYSAVEKFVKEKRVLEPDPAAPAAGAEETGAGQVAQVPERSAQAVASGPIRSREDAFKRLAEVVEYFRKAEPHNPVAYLVERAIKWGQMPLDAWLIDVVKNDAVLEQVRETLGLKPEPK